MERRGSIRGRSHRRESIATRKGGLCPPPKVPRRKLRKRPPIRRQKRSCGKEHVRKERNSLWKGSFFLEGRESNTKGMEKKEGDDPGYQPDRSSKKRKAGSEQGGVIKIGPSRREVS